MLSEDDFTTELDDGSEVPLRWFGDSTILAYDHLFPFEFASDVQLLLAAAGENPDHNTDSLTHTWEYALSVDFDSDPPTIQYTDSNDWHGTPITAINWW